MEHMLPCQPFEDRSLRCAFLHSLRRLGLSDTGRPAVPALAIAEVVVIVELLARDIAIAV